MVIVYSIAIGLIFFGLFFGLFLSGFEKGGIKHTGKERFILIYFGVLLSVCIPGISFMILYSLNENNTKYLYEFKPDRVEVIDSTYYDTFNEHKIEFIVHKGENKYLGYLFFEPEKDFNKSKFDFHLKDINGNLVWSTIFNDDKSRLQQISETFNLNIK